MTKPIVESLNIHIHLHSNLNMTMSDYILDGHCNMPDYLIQKHTCLAQHIISITLHVEDCSDRLNWVVAVDGELTSNIAYNSLRLSCPKLNLWDQNSK